ncbi:MAG: hypothetical protein R3A13_01560 [Bdellovibrionota bacterium]
MFENAPLITHRAPRPDGYKPFWHRHEEMPEDYFAALKDIPAFFDNDSFNSYCRQVIECWPSDMLSGAATEPLHAELSSKILDGGHGVIPTDWGGVVIERHEHPHVEKYLVVNRGGYLAFETHAEKIEHLEVREGKGVLLFRPEDQEQIVAQLIQPGFEILLKPGQEHCLIGIENLVVFEKSDDFKGMDQDLIFIFEPS